MIQFDWNDYYERLRRQMRADTWNMLQADPEAYLRDRWRRLNDDEWWTRYVERDRASWDVRGATPRRFR